MEDRVKKLKKTLLELRVDKKCNTYTRFMDIFKDWQIFLPLLGELKDPAMESADKRHWKKVMDLVKKEFTIDNNLIL